MENIWRIDEKEPEIWAYLNERDENERYTNRNSTYSEKDFITNIMKQGSLPGAVLQCDGYFSTLRALDKMLLAEKEEDGFGRTVKTEYGYLTEEELKEILKWLYVERFVVSHGEDGKEDKNLDRALQDFISDKYGSGVHFFEEVLQNIDDAIGRSKGRNAEQSVEISWGEQQISFTYPDRGFSFYDLVAITSLGNSSKKGKLDEASIGEKGIGFKSVFNVAERVTIQSRFFEFDIVYDENRKASVLQPSSITSGKTGKCTTQMTLYFSDKFDIFGENGFKSQLRKWLFENRKENYLQFSPFLFLKHIRAVDYYDADGAEYITIQRSPFSGESPFTLVNINGFRYVCYTEAVEFNKALIVNRWGDAVQEAVKDKGDDFSIVRPVEVAFPVTEGELTEVKEKKGLFFSYLPTEMEVDVPLYINVDVHLKSSRGRIGNSDFSEGSEWNKHLKAKLKSVLINAFEAIKSAYGKEDAIAEIKQIAERLYLYIGEQKADHYFREELSGFYKEIIVGRNFLNVKKEFVYLREFWIPGVSNREDWTDMVEFCLHRENPGVNKYAFDYGWHGFAARVSSAYNKDYSWKKNLLTQIGGVKAFYLESVLEQKEKNRIVLKFLEALDGSKKKQLSVLFLEPAIEEDGVVRIDSVENIEKEGKAVFFPADSEKGIEEDELSVYVKNVFGEDVESYTKYKELLRNIVDEKNWSDYLENLLKQYEEEEPYLCFEKTKKYLHVVKAELSKVAVPDQLRKKFGRYVLPGDVWDVFEKMDSGRKGYCKKIADYLEAKGGSAFGYQLWRGLSEEERKEESVLLYLAHLGVKTTPEVAEGQGMDALTEAVMPSFDGVRAKLDALELEYTGEEPELQQYLVEWMNKQRVNLDCFKKYFPEKFFDKFIVVDARLLKNGYDFRVSWLGERGGDKGTESFLIKGFEECSLEDSNIFHSEEKIFVNNGTYGLVDKEKYPIFHGRCLWTDVSAYASQYKDIRDVIANNACVKSIINGYESTNLLHKLRWIHIWNQVFSTSFGYNNDYSMGINEFISCHYYLSMPQIDSLFRKGYTVNWPEQNQPVVATEESLDYIQNEWAEWELSLSEEELSDYCFVAVESGKEQIIYLDENRYTKLNNKDKKYIICISNKSEKPKTDFLFGIIQTKLAERFGLGRPSLLYFSNLFKEEQILELQDILGEIKNKEPKRIVGITASYEMFTEALFREDAALYDGILDDAKKILPSIWKKRSGNTWGMKEMLCESFRTRGQVFQGYGYQCPICGTTAKHRSLTGMSFVKRIKNADERSRTQLPHLHFIACLNCREMLESATKVKIQGEKNESLTELVRHFEEVCYCGDNEHFQNHSKMKTVKLLLEIDGHEFVQKMKLSYLHFALFSKLWKR